MVLPVLWTQEVHGTCMRNTIYVKFDDGRLPGHYYRPLFRIEAPVIVPKALNLLSLGLVREVPPLSR